MCETTLDLQANLQITARLCPLAKDTQDSCLQRQSSTEICGALAGETIS